MNTELVIANIGKHINLNRTEVDFFLSLLTARELKRKDFLLKAGEICNRLNYVNTGSLRAFYRDEADKETTQMFAISDWWITDMPCFINQQPAMVYIEAIADSSILELTKDNMDALLLEVPKFERFFRIIFQNAYVREQLRAIHRLSLPAEIRYDNFLKNYKTIAKVVSQKNIASYLGITPEFLSAIRSKRRKG